MEGRTPIFLFSSSFYSRSESCRNLFPGIKLHLWNSVPSHCSGLDYSGNLSGLGKTVSVVANLQEPSDLVVAAACRPCIGIAVGYTDCRKSKDTGAVQLEQTD